MLTINIACVLTDTQITHLKFFWFCKPAPKSAQYDYDPTDTIMNDSVSNDVVVQGDDMVANHRGSNEPSLSGATITVLNTYCYYCAE